MLHQQWSQNTPVYVGIGKYFVPLMKVYWKLILIVNYLTTYIIAVHGHRTMFIPESDSIPVGVGTETHIKLKWQLREKLHVPHGNCIQDDIEVRIFILFSKNVLGSAV